MSRVVLLDSGPLGLATNPKASPATEECNRWIESLLAKEVRLVIPEIADYEVRRELLRANRTRGLQRLNNLKDSIGYLPISTEAMLKAAELWADARRHGQPTAPDPALDADVILAAQAVVNDWQGDDAVIATTNVGHLRRYVAAQLWQEIR